MWGPFETQRDGSICTAAREKRKVPLQARGGKKRKQKVAPARITGTKHVKSKGGEETLQRGGNYINRKEHF